MTNTLSNQISELTSVLHLFIFFHSCRNLQEALEVVHTELAEKAEQIER